MDDSRISFLGNRKSCCVSHICAHWLPPHISQSITTSLIAPYETLRLPNIIRSLGHARTLPPAYCIQLQSLDAPRQLDELAEKIGLVS